MLGKQLTMEEKHAKINASMIRVCPELESEYARYPLQYEAWLNPSEKGPKDAPCFISAPKGSPVRMDYIHGPGRFGWGYYHVLTIDSYKALYARLTQETPLCCCGPKSYRHAWDWQETHSIVYSRSVASKPDDVQGRKDAVEMAQGEMRGLRVLAM